MIEIDNIKFDNRICLVYGNHFAGKTTLYDCLKSLKNGNRVNHRVKAKFDDWEYYRLVGTNFDERLVKITNKNRRTFKKRADAYFADAPQRGQYQYDTEENLLQLIHNPFERLSFVKEAGEWINKPDKLCDILNIETVFVDGKLTQVRANNQWHKNLWLFDLYYAITHNPFNIFDNWGDGLTSELEDFMIYEIFNQRIRQQTQFIIFTRYKDSVEKFREKEVPHKFIALGG